jgi:hypothetical protein
MQWTRPASVPGDAGTTPVAPLAMPSVLSGGVLTPASRPARGGELLTGSRDADAPYSLLLTLACVVMIRVVVFAAGILSIDYAGPDDLERYASGAPWIAFDAQWYLSISQQGYPGPGDATDAYPPPDIAFFPLLPLAARALSPFLSAGPALLIIANVCTLIGLGFFYEWSKRLTSARTAFWACLLLATFPTAAFFGAGVTEGPFMMCSAIALFLLQRQWHYSAALVAMAASLLRPTSVALAMVVVLWVWVRHLMLVHPELFARPAGAWRDWLTRARWARLGGDLRQVALATLSPKALGRLALIGAISTAGIAAYQCYLWQKYDDFGVYFKVQTYWEPGGLRTEEARRIEQINEMKKAAEVRDLGYYARKAMTPQAWNRGLMLLFVGLAIYGLVKQTPIRRELFVMPLVIFLMTYVPGWGTRASSIARYETAAVMCFLLMAMILLTWKRPALLAAVVAGQLGLQVYYAFLFSRGVWIG